MGNKLWFLIKFNIFSILLLLQNLHNRYFFLNKTNLLQYGRFIRFISDLLIIYLIDQMFTYCISAVAVGQGKTTGRSNSYSVSQQLDKYWNFSSRIILYCPLRKFVSSSWPKTVMHFHKFPFLLFFQIPEFPLNQLNSDNRNFIINLQKMQLLFSPAMCKVIHHLHLGKIFSA